MNVTAWGALKCERLPRSRLQYDKRMRRLAPSLVGHANDADFLNRRVAHQGSLHFDGGNILAATDDDDQDL